MNSGVSIIIPVFNEEKIIERSTLKLMKFLRELRMPYEIILSNNGSADRTFEIAKKLQKKYPQKVRAISIPQKGWVGVAFANAVKISKYKNIISQDMDLSSDLNFIPKCLRLLDNYSIVIGSKRRGVQKRTLFRILSSSSFIFMSRILLNLNYSDYSLGAKGYKKTAIIKELENLDKESFYPVQLFFYAKRQKKKIIEIPVNNNDSRNTKFNFYYEIAQRLPKLVALWLRNII